VRNNKNANYVLLDSVHRLYHDVLYFQNVINFHGTGVRELRITPERKLRHSLRRVSRDSQMCTGIMFRALLRISIKQHNKCGSSRNSQASSKYLRVFLLPNSIQIG
jgi:hypothetical protein